MKVKIVLLITIMILLVISGSAIKFTSTSAGANPEYCRKHFCKCYPMFPRCKGKSPKI